MPVDLKDGPQSDFKERIEGRLSHLRFDQDQINEKDDEVMLDIFVGKPFALRALCQTHAFTDASIIGLAVGCVQGRHRR
jgi:hypothetical protein